MSLQELFDQVRSFSTLRRTSVLAVQLLKCVRHLRPFSTPIAPTWDLDLVLDALSEAPFRTAEVCGSEDHFATATLM
jgi:hypothetical protein